MKKRGRNSIIQGLILLLCVLSVFFSQPLCALAYERDLDSMIENEGYNPDLPDGYIETEEYFDLGKGVSASDFSPDKVEGICLLPTVVYSQRLEDIIVGFEDANGKRKENPFYTEYDKQGLGPTWNWALDRPLGQRDRIVITTNGLEGDYELKNFNFDTSVYDLHGAPNSKGFYRRLNIFASTLNPGTPMINISGLKFEDGIFSMEYSGEFKIVTGTDPDYDVDYMPKNMSDEEKKAWQEEYQAFAAAVRQEESEEIITINSRNGNNEYFVTRGGKLALRIDHGDLATYFRVDGIKPSSGQGGSSGTKPGDQEVVTPGSKKSGEDEGTGIDNEIIEGSKGSKGKGSSGEVTDNKKDNKLPKALPIGLLGAVGGALVGGLTGRKKQKDQDENKEEEKQPSSYKMYVKKDFGNLIKKGEGARLVYARIAEVLPGGTERPRDDLSAQIQVFSGDGNLEVSDGGFAGGYKAAGVMAAPDCNCSEGQVSFKFTGAGGTFVRHVVFQIDSAGIVFAQENLGLPACRLKFVEGDGSRLGKGEYRLPFLVKGMPKGYSVKAFLTRAGSTDMQGRYIPASKISQPIPYSMEVIPDPEDGAGDIYLAVIRETGDYELEAGLSEGFELKVRAEYGTPDTPGYDVVEGRFPVYRIHLGLVLTVESSSIPCYTRLKPQAKNKDRDEITSDDLEVVYTEGSLMLFLCNEKDLSIIRMPVTPDRELKVTSTKVENDRYCRTGDAQKSHQDLVDKLGLSVFSTNKIDQNGAHIVRFTSTRASLDPPTRLLADVEVTARHQGRVYTVKKNLLLRSQDFRVAKNAAKDRAFLEEDEKIRERLLRINLQILNNYSLNLMPLADMIDRMLEGYDIRFGYDPHQVELVMNMWVGFLEGTFAGANGTPKGITIGDEIAATYAFLQGLRDNTTIFGRIVMGVMTVGYSEHLFTTMTVLEKMQEKVFSCKGDKDFGIWDGVEIGVKELSRQVLLELTMTNVLGAAGAYISSNTNIDIPATLAMWGKRYRGAMDAADTWMRSNSALYRLSDDALRSCKNVFNSSAKGVKSALDDTIAREDNSALQLDGMVKKARGNLSADEAAELARYEKDMSDAMESVRKLQAAQQEMEAAADTLSLKLAKTKYIKYANEVWDNPNAVRQLQWLKHSYADRMRAQFNNYREPLLDQVQKEALSDISKETGIPLDELYTMNASNGSKTLYYQGKKLPSDRDISFKEKVLSDRTKDITINQSLGERTVAYRFFRKINGRDPVDLKEALDFMKKREVTYVNPEKDSAISYVSEHNLEGYEDLQGMTGIKYDGTMDKSLMKNDLHNKVLNQKSVSYKGMEYFEKGDIVGGAYQISKQVDNIVIARGILRTGKNPLPEMAMKIHSLAKATGAGQVSPTYFKKILREEYNMTPQAYADYMAKFLD